MKQKNQRKINKNESTGKKVEQRGSTNFPIRISSVILTTTAICKTQKSFW
jgi:hypothetical protein